MEKKEWDEVEEGRRPQKAHEPSIEELAEQALKQEENIFRQTYNND